MESTMSSMVIEEYHKERERLNNVINDVTTASRKKDAVIQTIEAELKNIRESKTKCCPKIKGKRRLPWTKKNTVDVIHTKEDEENWMTEQTNGLKIEGGARNENDLIQDSQSSQRQISRMEYDCFTLEEKNKRLRDLVENLETHLRETAHGPILDARTTADFAVIASLGYSPRSVLNIHDVITFHATSVINNDFKFKEIGRGAFGRVMLARHTSSSDTIVIKVPIIPAYSSPAMVKAAKRSNFGQFMKEAVVSEFFSMNAHFPKLYGTLMLEDDMCIVQEFIGDKATGKVFPLLNIMKSNPSPFLSPGSLLDIAVDVLEGVGFIHSHGLLHNDIKADNVLLELRNGRWQGFIIDQGLVSTIAFPPCVAINQSIMDDHNNKLSGNVYVAPEVIDDGTALSVASDIYSVGAVLVLIGRAARLQDLVAIGETCSRKEPMLRPRSLEEVMQKVQGLK